MKTTQTYFFLHPNAHTSASFNSSSNDDFGFICPPRMLIWTIFPIDMDSLMSDSFHMDFSDDFSQPIDSFSSRSASASVSSYAYTNFDDDEDDDFDLDLDESDMLLNELIDNGDFDSDIEDVLSDSKSDSDDDDFGSYDQLETDSLQILSEVVDFSADLTPRGFSLSIDPRRSQLSL
eukprot:TRINITY_DN13031_c0_g1_i1.p1 TRINITY_DN13031_c0_g1~~TRINITY_DN13031_c0_g1_i1.p1  ORF type:complete len:177 (+),score=35.92 TRINITY_DN13031_c0_g1_i1:201-731(+)